MTQQAILGLFLLFILNAVLVLEAKKDKADKVTIGKKLLLDNEYQNVKSKTYNIVTSIVKKSKSCTKKVTVTGNGVGDVLDLPCSKNGVFTVASDKVLIYGYPEEDKFSLYSNQPSSMIVYRENKCTKRTYKKKRGCKKIYAEISTLNEDECKKFLTKVNYIVGQESNHIDTFNHRTEEEEVHRQEKKRH